MNQNVENNEIEIDLLELFYLLKSKILLLCLSAVVFGAIAFSYTEFVVRPLYSSTSQLFILSKSTSLTSLADIQVGTQLTQDYLEMIKSRPVVEEVIKNLGVDYEYEEMAEKLSVTNPTDTRILKITATVDEPELAKKIADEFANVSKVRISEIMRTDEPSVFAYGYVDDEPVNVHLLKNSAVGALGGLFVAAAVVIVMYLLNDTVQTPEDVEKYLGLNTLTSVPLQGGSKQEKARKKKKKEMMKKYEKLRKKRGK